jgi:hypothetical protein
MIFMASPKANPDIPLPYRPDGNAAGRYRARHRSGVRAWLCLQRVPGAPAHQDREEPWLRMVSLVTPT